MSMAAADNALRPGIAGGLPLPEMGEGQFQRWAALLQERTGMVLPRERKSFLVTSVGLRMRERGYRDFDAYLEFLRSGRAGAVEWAALVDRLTVHETRFFRDPRALAFVARTCLPEWIARVAAGEAVQIWSAGCATGEEAWTLACVVDAGLRAEGLPSYFGVTGSDISLLSLGAARRAVYGARRRADIPARHRDDYCEPSGDGSFRIAARLRRRVCFAQMNLLHAAGEPLPSMDLIYCQNVLIYFDRAWRERIVDGLAARLRPGGVLVLGAGELVGWSRPGLQRTGGPDVLAFRRGRR